MSDAFDSTRLLEELKARAERERESGAYANDLSDVQLDRPGSPVVDGFDLGGDAPRVRFRPELGFSSKPVVGPAITLVKRFYLRLLLHVFDDLARQADTAIAKVEAALAVEVAARERLEQQVEQLQAQLARLEQRDR